MIYKCLGVLTLALTLTACCSNAIRNTYTDSTPDEIQLLISTKYEKSLYAVGTAHGPDESIALNKATVQARAEIARIFRSSIELLEKDFVEALHEQAAGEYTQVLKLFSQLEISGSRVEKTMIRKDKDNLYSAKVLVVVSAEQVKELLDRKLRDYTSFKATKAYRELEQRVELERKLKNEISVE